MQGFSPKASSVLEKIFKVFYHIWAWQLSWSTDCNHFSNLSFPQPKKAPTDEIWANLAQGLQKRSHLKMLTDGRTDIHTGRWEVITIAHPEHSSGELKTRQGSCHKNPTPENSISDPFWQLELVFVKHYAPNCLTLTLLDSNTACPWR